jgi:3-methyladenine DNA glycosylase AlkD
VTPDEVRQRLRELGDPKNVAGMARYGITPEKAYGVRVPDLRRLGREIGIDRRLARELWKAGSREERILASLIEDPAAVTESQMERWAKAFSYWEICDAVCMNVFQNTPFAWDKALEWSRREEEFVKRAGFVLMARLAVADKKAGDERFEPFLPAIVEGATDTRNQVKKGVSWALRQIGKRNRRLNRAAIRAAESIRRAGIGGSRWVAGDALRELRSAAVQERLARRA